MPGEVGGEHVDQHVAADPVAQPVVDGAEVQIIGLEGAEVTFDAAEVLVPQLSSSRGRHVSDIKPQRQRNFGLERP